MLVTRTDPSKYVDSLLRLKTESHILLCFRVQGTISISKDSSCFRVPPESEVASDALAPGITPKSAVPEHCLCVNASSAQEKEHRSYYLVAESADEFEAWVTVLEQAIEVQLRNDGPLLRNAFLLGSLLSSVDGQRGIP